MGLENRHKLAQATIEVTIYVASKPGTIGQMCYLIDLIISAES